MKQGLMIAVLLLSAMASYASYEVPGFPEGEAVYDLSLRLEVKGEEVVAKYELPIALTGVVNKISLKGSFIGNGLAALSGDKGELLCNFVEEKCDAKYKDITVDLGAVESLAKAAGLDKQQILKRIEISKEFKGDPIGIIRLSK